jgi:hypothetical protein
MLANAARDRRQPVSENRVRFLLHRGTHRFRPPRLLAKVALLPHGIAFMFGLLRLLAIAAIASLLASCGPPTHPINPPSASIQQIDVLPDGRWKVQIRIENFSDKTQHYTTFKAALRVSGIAAADILLNPELDIPGDNADIVETTFAPGTDLTRAFNADVARPNGAPYELKGTITIPAAGKDFKFEHKSRLSAVPGIPNEYR